MAPAFSARTRWDTAESPLSAAIARARAAGRPLLDLTVSNPTACGFHYPPALLEPLRNPSALTYSPHPLGLPAAREAVAAYYAAHGALVSPSQLLLTTSTSEAYSFLFRLLCDPGDAVLVAQPSYPLFQFLAELNDIRLTPYPLFHDFGWWIDLAELERSITPRTRAILVVHPNNPTGHATAQPERERLQELCLRHHLALIVDEVFLDYPLAAPIPSFAAGPHPCLTFVLSGLSKIAALPQMKTGWIASFGPQPSLDQALTRLEIVADTFLSLSAPIQHALPTWLQGRELIQRQILARLRENLALLTASGLRHLAVEAGWAVIVQLPPERSHSAQPLEVRLVEQAGVIVHPGSFYDLPHPRQFVLSLLPPPEVFKQGLSLLRQASL